jgi:hypothetical protein
MRLGLQSGGLKKNQQSRKKHNSKPKLKTSLTLSSNP